MAELRLQEVPQGGARFQRDLEIHSLSQQFHRLNRLGTENCLGRYDRSDGSRVYIGRIGVRDDGGQPLLVDWRTPAAAPFFAATLRDAMGVTPRHAGSRGSAPGRTPRLRIADARTGGLIAPMLTVSAAANHVKRGACARPAAARRLLSSNG